MRTCGRGVLPARGGEQRLAGSVIASEAKQSTGPKPPLDCFVATLLTMTAMCTRPE
jgi:hypothetical protein